MNYEPIGIDRYAKFDSAISRGRIANYKHVPCWQSVVIRCLQSGDFDAAQFIVDRNERRTDLELRAVMLNQAVIISVIESIKAA